MSPDTLLYHFSRTIVRFSLQFYCKRLSFEGLENIPKDKAILFCGTHANSFLDALFLATCMDYPVYPLARGDAFRNPKIARILWQYKVLPIFRQSEGEAEAAAKNEASFQTSVALFREGQKVLIFPEGVCKHQREVLPLKKGAAVIAQRAWREGIDLEIVPVSIDYDSFFKWGKNCDVIFGKPLQKADFQDIIEENIFAKDFNNSLHSAMNAIYPSPFQFQGNKLFNGNWSIFLFYFGLVFQAPHYVVCYFIGKKLAKGTIFHDSAVLGVTAVLLPFYYLMLAILAYCLFI